MKKKEESFSQQSYFIEDTILLLISSYITVQEISDKIET